MGRGFVTLPLGVPNKLFVGREWLGGSGGSFEVLNPSTGGLICAVARTGADDVVAAVSAAAEAQPKWAAAALRERGEVLRKAFELMTAHADDLAYLISLEMASR